MIAGLLDMTAGTISISDSDQMVIGLCPENLRLNEKNYLTLTVEPALSELQADSTLIYGDVIAQRARVVLLEKGSEKITETCRFALVEK